MRLGPILTALAGLVVAGGTVFLAKDILSTQAGQGAAISQTGNTVPVVIARHDIGFASVIEADMLTVIDWPKDHVPDGVFTSIEALLPQDGQDPRRSRRIISQGDPLRGTTISDFGEKVTIVQTLSPNTRAMAIRVNAETAVGGVVTPGDRVDVVLTQGRGDRLRAVTILQNVRIVGVDQDVDETEGRAAIARTVTVEVSADQSQRLALAQQAGTLSLSLRSLEDEADQALEALQLSDLMNEPAVELDQLEDPGAIVRVRRGTDVVETDVMSN